MKAIGLISGKLCNDGQASLPYGESGSLVTNGFKLD